MSDWVKKEDTLGLGELWGDNNSEGPPAADWLLGLEGNDGLFGLEMDDKLEGGDGNDDLDGGSGDDLLDGGAGNDIARYEGMLSDYRIIKLDADSYEVEYIGATPIYDGTDKITNVEEIHVTFGAANVALVRLGDGPRGAVTVGEGETEGTLEASIDVQGGATPENISYQWMRNGEQISVSDSATYTLTAADDGQEITVVAHYVVDTGLDTWRFESVSSNRAPTSTTEITNQTATEDAPFSFVLPEGTFADDDAGDTLTLSATLSGGGALPAWLSFDAASGTFSGTPANGDVGTIAVKVTATDGSDASATDEFTITVANVNDAPTGDVTITGTATQGQVLTASHNLADADGLGPVSYQWQRDGEAIEDATGTTYTLTQADVGAKISVVASYKDLGGADESTTSAESDTVANINDAPTVAAAIENQSATEDALFSFVVPAGTFADIDAGDTRTLTATLSDDSALPGWLTFNADTRTFSGTPANGNVGSISVKVTAKDGANASVSDEFTITVSNVNDAPTVAAAIENQSATEDAPFSFVVPAGTFADVDTGDTPTLSAALSGGGALPGWLTFNADTRTFSGTPANGDVGTITVKVTATDGSDASATDEFTITVTNVNDAPTGGVTITGTATQGQVLTASHNLADADGLGPVSYQWQRDGEAIEDATGTTYTLTQADVGAKISVVASYKDLGGADESTTSAESDTVANINDAPTVAAAIENQSATEDAPFSFVVPAGTFADIDAGDTQTLTATLSDDSALPGWLTFNADTRTFSGTPANGNVGSISVKVTAKDGANASVSDEFTITVSNVNDAPTGGVTITGTATQGQELTASHNIADEDGLGLVTYQWLRGGEAIAGATGTTYTLTQADVGKAISVKASYTDEGGADESKTSTATDTVANINDGPTGGVSITGTATQGQELTASHNLADADGLGPVSYQWLRGGEAIAGATGTTYTLTQADVGKAISVKASYTDEGGANESKTSTATDAVADANAAPTGGVSITGTATQGQVLTASHNLADEDGLGPVSYQWLRDGEAIEDATGATYTLTQADVGKAISVKASYTDEGGADESRTSAATAAVADVNEAPIFASSTAAVDFVEGATAVAYTAAATDADNQTVLTYGISGADAFLFNINTSTGALTFKHAPDFEAPADTGKDNVYNIAVTATDGIETATQAVTITVMDANEAPTDIILSSTAAWENLEAGGVIAAITGTDSNIGDVLSISIVEDESELFAIVGGKLVLREDASLDRETAGSHTVTIRVEDAHGGTFDKEFTIEVKDVVEGDADDEIINGADTDQGFSGGAGYDIIDARGGDDILFGGDGFDVLIGGTGNDIYVLGDGDDAVADESGTDTITSTVTRSILGYGKIENLTLEGDDDIDGTGNGLNNRIQGNVGNNVLDGGAGYDVLIGGDGDDTFVLGSDDDDVVEETGGGSDTVTSTISRNLADFRYIENITLEGTAAINAIGDDKSNILIGNSAANTIDGGAGNDVLDGGEGVDKLIGGGGNDTFIFDGKDNIVEAANQGIDTVESSVNLTLAANLENLVLTGAATSGTGNSLANVITGNANKNVLNGGTGADTLKGGNGDDTYVTDGGDTITEALDEGTDTVQSSATVVALSANVENLVLTGSAAINGTGNALDNVITGNGGANTLNGGDGDDAIIGGLGKDKLIGGAGDDAFVFNTKASSTNIDVISDFEVGIDTVTLENAIFTAFKTLGALDANAFVSNTTGKATDKYDRIVYESDTGKLFYDADGNAKGAAIQFATLGKNLTLTHDDFWII